MSLLTPRVRRFHFPLLFCIMTKTLMCTMLALVAVAAQALELDDFQREQLRGYRLIHSGYVTGYVDHRYPGKEKSWEFEGCDFDRVIVIDEQYGVTCRTYSYSYSYHPEAYIFSNGYQKKLLVNRNLYDVD